MTSRDCVLTTFVILLATISAPAPGEVIKGFDLPPKLAGLTLAPVNSETVKTGTGTTFVYYAPNFEVSVSIYDKTDQMVLDDSNAGIVRMEFHVPPGHICSLYSGATITKPRYAVTVGSIRYLTNTYRLTDPRYGPIMSHLLITNRHGKLIKILSKYSAKDKSRQGIRTHVEFINEFSRMLNK